MSNIQKRFLISYPKSSPVVITLEKCINLMDGIYTAPEIVKIAIKEFYDKLNTTPDLTLQDIERIGWANISTQELVDRYPPYRKQYQELDDLEMCSQEENDAINKQLGLYV